MELKKSLYTILFSLIALLLLIEIIVFTQENFKSSYEIYTIISAFIVSFFAVVGDFSNTRSIFLAIIFSASLIYWWILSPGFLVNNIVNFCLIYAFLKWVSSPSFKIVLLVAVALFFYDFISVFITGRMIEMVVASIDIKSYGFLNFKYFGLGVGDIVMPGILIKSEYSYLSTKRTYVISELRIIGKRFDFLKELPLVSVITTVSYLIGLCLGLLFVFVIRIPQPLLVYIFPVMFLAMYISHKKYVLGN